MYGLAHGLADVQLGLLALHGVQDLEVALLLVGHDQRVELTLLASCWLRLLFQGSLQFILLETQ